MPQLTSLHPIHLRDQVITPALAFVASDVPLPGFDSAVGIEMVLGTWAAESGLTKLVQDGGGPGSGLGQAEEATAKDILANYVSYRPKLLTSLEHLRAIGLSLRQNLVGNLPYAAVMTRLAYWRHTDPLPARGDIAGYARLWKKVYNTPAGKGSEQHFIDAWGRLVAPYL